jgi:glycosyltransferase involved in cell wall biosynthesis
LVVVGQGAELPFWQARVRALGMTERIQFLGFRKDVGAIMRASDLLIAPTRYEAYGLSVREALATGIAVVVSAQAGVAEHLAAPLDALLLQNPDDASELVDKLKYWRSSEPHILEHVSALSRRIREHTWEHMAAEFAALIEAVHARRALLA